MEDDQCLDRPSVSVSFAYQADSSEQAINDLHIDFRAIEDVSLLYE